MNKQDEPAVEIVRNTLQLLEGFASNPAMYMPPSDVIYVRAQLQRVLEKLEGKKVEAVTLKFRPKAIRFHGSNKDCPSVKDGTSKYCTGHLETT